MDKKTLLAIVLSVVVISIGFYIQNIFFPPSVPPQETRQIEQQKTEELVQTTEQPHTEEIDTIPPSTRPGGVIPAEGDGTVLREIKAETDLFLITFSPKGGTISSLKLKEHKTSGEYVEMILGGESGRDAFNIYFGDHTVDPVDAGFKYRRYGEDTFEFSRDFYAPAENDKRGNLFTLKKKYIFKPGEYLFELQITIENSVREYPALNFDGIAYTLGFGPQIGPKFEKLDRRHEFRKYYVYSGGKRKEIKIPDRGYAEVSELILWAGIAGKYFTMIGIPDATIYNITFAEEPVPGIPSGSQMYFSRPVIKSSSNTDVFRIYVGPKTRSELSSYNNTGDNDFGINGLDLDEIMEMKIFLGWLENILKFFLVAFYRVIPNYGIAIILLTLLIKLILYPFTRKSYESTSKMQKLSPKINELREKYKNNPQKMNKEMAELYKKEGVNPLGGCLPMLLQLPVFIALYGLLTSHFDLRGATFIPGWIDDLSSPEYIFNFAPYSIPLLGWSEIRLLPLLFLATQFLSSKFMQTPQSSSNKSMALMTYGMPLFIFFILYDAPSGLLLYWTVTNLITVVQQFYMTRIRTTRSKVKAGK